MIDCHCHILPGLDDGAKNLEDSLAMARVLVEHGFTGVIATPHVIDKDGWRHGPREIGERAEMLKAALKRENIALEVFIGAEYLFDRSFAEMVRFYHPLAGMAGSWYVLVELPMMHWPPFLFNSTFPKDDDPKEIRESLAFCKPIIAHPERNAEVIKNHRRLLELKQSGYHFQINLESILGSSGKQASKLARKLAKEGFIDLIGTDGHSAEGLRHLLSGWHKEAAKVLGPDLLRRVTNANPRAVIMNDVIERDY